MSSSSNITHLKKIKNTLFCANCGNTGHVFRNCSEHIISCGMITFKIDGFEGSIDAFDKSMNDFNQSKGINYERGIDIFCEYKDKIKFLLIQRKYTLGYLEFIRGRYYIENVDGIIFLFKQMTEEEIKSIGEKSFDELWDELWSVNGNKPKINNDYIKAKNKFMALKNETDDYLNLQFYIDNVKSLWNNPEWGFPKGRRNSRETNLQCAVREFKEETDFKEEDYNLLKDVGEIHEELIGTNGINYKHIYYSAICTNDKQPIINQKNHHQCSEVGNIGWFTYDATIKLLRPHHSDRQKIITQYFMHVINIIIEMTSK